MSIFISCDNGACSLLHRCYTLSQSSTHAKLTSLPCTQAIQSHLLPSLRRMIGVCFFAEGVNSLHASPSVRTML
jgi:hypothetical protein